MEKREKPKLVQKSKLLLNFTFHFSKYGASRRWKSTFRFAFPARILFTKRNENRHFFAVVLHDYNVKIPETS